MQRHEQQSVFGFRPSNFGVWTLVGLMLLGTAVLAQNSRFGVIRNFKLPEYYKPGELQPGQTNQFKSILMAREVRPKADRTAEVTDMWIATFDPTGATNLIVIAPKCLVDLDRRVAWSPDRLEVRSGDGRLVIEGKGFFCRLTNASVVISNQVRTFIHKDFVPSPIRKP